MSLTKTIEEVHAQVREDESGKWDAVVPRRDLTVRDGKLCFPDTYSGGYPNRLQPSQWATGQLCQKLSIPCAYYRRCPSVLQDMQANHWLRHPESAAEFENPQHAHNGCANGTDERTGDSQSIGQAAREEVWMLRAKYDSLRAVVSERYERMDNTDLMESLATLPLEHFRVGWGALSDESFHLRLIDPGTGVDALPKDRLMAGVHIANSEVGKRAITVDAIVFRVVCSNGLIHVVNGRNVLHRRHIQRAHSSLTASLGEAVHHAVVAAERCVLLLQRATGEHIIDVDAMIERLIQQWNLSQEAEKQVKRALLKETPGQQETWYGLINAFTNVAQRMPDDDRYHLELMAGRLLEQGHKSASQFAELSHGTEPAKRTHLRLLSGGERNGFSLPVRALNGR